MQSLIQFGFSVVLLEENVSYLIIKWISEAPIYHTS